MHYVVQRNTKEECIQQVLPRHGLPEKWNRSADAAAPAKEPTPQPPDTAAANAERAAVRQANEAMLAEMREIARALREETAALAEKEQRLGQEIDATESALRDAIAPFDRATAMILATHQ
jgi:DNA-binding NtrC family response regulator